MARFQHIDLAKGITIISIVFFHAAKTTDSTYYYYNYLELPALVIYSFIMPLFFMISAALLRTRLESDNFSNTVFLKKIILNILVPFYTLNILFFLIKFFFPNATEMTGVKETIQGLFYMQTVGDLLPSGVLWFLFVLFIFALITFISIKILKINIYILFALSVLLKLIHSYFYIDFNYFAFHKIIQYYIFYTSGYLLSDRILNAKFNSINLSIVGFLICWIISFYFTFIMKIQHLNNILVSFGVSGISSSFFILAFSHKLNRRFSSNSLIDFICFCGMNSILIYVFHTPSFFIIRKVIPYLNLSDSLWGLLFTFLCATLFPLIYGKVLSCNRFMYKLLLGRHPYI